MQHTSNTEVFGVGGIGPYSGSVTGLQLGYDNYQKSIRITVVGVGNYLCQKCSEMRHFSLFICGPNNSQSNRRIRSSLEVLNRILLSSCK